MKIVYVNTLFGKNAIGGAEKITRSLAEGMLRLGHQVIVVALHSEKEILKEDLNGIEVIYLPINNVYWPFDGKTKGNIHKILWHIVDSWNLKNGQNFRRLMSYLNPDIIHFHNIAGLSCSIIDRKGDNQLITLHDYYFKCYRSTMFKENNICNGNCIDCKIITLPRRLMSSYIPITVSVSDFVRTTLVQSGYFRNSENKIINNVVKFEDAQEIYKNSKVIRFGYIGRLTEEKGFGDLIKSFESLLTIENWELIVAGEGELKHLLNNVDRRIIYRGFVNSEEFFKEIDILIVPSKWHDPYPTVILEAFNYRIPVLGRLRGGITELISSISPSWLFDTNEELVDKIKLILKGDNLEEDVFASRSRGNSLSETGWLVEYESIYKKLC